LKVEKVIEKKWMKSPSDASQVNGIAIITVKSSLNLMKIEVIKS
jgi:hypothetical protein